MKIANLQDNHVHPKWIEESKRHIKKVCEVVIAEKIDGITISGDFFHSAIMANDKGAWADVLQLARDLQEAAPVYYITGTLSHDSPGCYDSFKDIGWKEINIGKSEVLGDLLIMGIPEITPAFILAQSPGMTKIEAIEKQYDLVDQIINDVYVPMSLNHNGPVHFMGHGHVSGAKFRDDQKPRTSEFMYSEQLLSKIKTDFIQFGHIHFPQEFKFNDGGYGGSSHITWNDLNFVPGFDVVSFIDGSFSHKERFNYGDPMRQKFTIKDLSTISLAEQDLIPGSNIWIDIECDKSFAEQFDTEESLKAFRLKNLIGPLSKITCNIQRVENVRVETEEYEKCKTLEDLYKIWDSEVNKTTLLKVHEAEEATKAETGAVTPRNFEFLYLYLKGSKAGRENGVNEIRVDFQEFLTGANLLTGSNGTGKSFTLGFMTPFSKHLPTGIDLKSLFELKDSEITRAWRDGSDVITQKILIDPTLASPTAKYFMDINGQPVVTVTGNKAPFDDAVSDIFGSIKMFMTCAFRGQKDNPDFPSLENAKETDLRKIFTELSGIDRTPLKNYAHSKAGEISRDIELDQREAETLEANKGDIDSIEIVIDEAERASEESKKASKKYESSISELGLKLSGFDKDITKNESVNKQVGEFRSKGTNLTADNALLDSELWEISGTLKNSDGLKLELSEIEKKKEEYSIVSNDYLERSEIHSNLMETWNKDRDNKNAEKEIKKDKAEDLKGQITAEERTANDAKHSIEQVETENSFLNKPCEHCNKLSSTADHQITSNLRVITETKRILKESQDNIISLNESLEGYRDEWKTINDSIPAAPVAPEKLNLLKIEMDRLKPDLLRHENIRIIINGLAASEKRKTEIEVKLKSNREHIEAIEAEVVNLKLNLIGINMASYNFLKSQSDKAKLDLSSNNTEIGRLTARIEALNNDIQKVREVEAKIETINQRTNKQQINKSEWARIEEAFSPKGIPALELSMIAPQIDREANKLLSSYGSRFAVETITQALDSRGKTMLEKFKILVHDSMASEVKNLPVMSGGQSVWVTKAIQEAISKVATERTGRNWLYSVMDEADAALDQEAIVDFYDMMDRAMDGTRKLISVSHNPEAKSVISKIVEITKFFIGYGE